MKSIYANIAIASLTISLIVSFLALGNKENWANNSFNIPYYSFSFMGNSSNNVAVLSALYFYC